MKRIFASLDGRTHKQCELRVTNKSGHGDGLHLQCRLLLLSFEQRFRLSAEPIAIFPICSWKTVDEQENVIASPEMYTELLTFIR